ncbi:MAG: HAMP domain-containing histidine kinase [Spirochaetaceae bacterium]|jgi:signal transduction histidine kinase|nr:HAMP domain-containing histidine kinase [Spirochaetaceae bacterium]
MKIQTQFHLLITGIIAVPLILILGQLLYHQSSKRQEQTEIGVYEDIAAMMDTRMDIEDRAAMSRFIFRVSRMGDITIFRKDLLVLYSTIPEFTAGVYEGVENIFAFMSGEDRRHGYTFESPGWMSNSGYILIRRDLPPPGGPPRMFFPVIILFIFLLPIIFAITMSLLIARSITKSVLVLENATRRIAEGELDITIDVRGSNEITSLTNSLNKMRNALKEEEQRRYRFIMGVTHDLKTPLALIKAYTEAIEDGITEDPASHISATEIISAKADQLEGMINDLLEYVQMDSGEWRSRLQKVNITTFLRNTAKTFLPDAELLHHEFRSEITLPENLFVFMDERLSLRALENLVNNAIRYTPDGSVIVLSAGLTEGKADGGTNGKAPNMIRLTVSDNGPGINKTDLPHIFEMFYRGTSSRREQGMGMGLAVVKWVVDSHGWSISVSSKPEGKKGTDFCIAIPIGYNDTRAANAHPCK